MKIKHSRTGLALEHGLYSAAQKKSARLGQSFAAYITDLIVLDLIQSKETGISNLPDVRRVKGLIKPKNPAIKAFRKVERDEMRKMQAELETNERKRRAS